MIKAVLDDILIQMGHIYDPVLDAFIDPDNLIYPVRVKYDTLEFTDDPKDPEPICLSRLLFENDTRTLVEALGYKARRRGPDIVYQRKDKTRMVYVSSGGYLYYNPRNYSNSDKITFKEIM